MRAPSKSDLTEDNPEPRQARALVRALVRWFEQNARDLPWRRVRDPYAIWVSEIMLQQTQVKTVLPYWVRWMREMPEIKDLANAELEQLHKLWEGLGYYSRVRNMQAAARVIEAEHNGCFPQDYDAVLRLPGIGPYTAGAICSIAGNQPVPILDGNVTRVLSRLYAIAGNPKARGASSRLWDLARSLVETAAKLRDSARQMPQRWMCSLFNQSLMELGALICVPRKPKCAECPVKTHCLAFQNGATESFPETGPRAKTTQRRFAAFVVRNGNRYLVRQRAASGVNSHLWEFPNFELKSAPGIMEAAGLFFGGNGIQLEPLVALKHTITRYRITLDVYRAEFSRPLGKCGLEGRWASAEDLLRLPFSSAHRKIARLLGKPGDAQ